MISPNEDVTPMRYSSALFIHSLFVIQILAILCAFTKPAYAYIDPGAGLFALQTISTTIAGMVFLIRKKVRRLFGHGHSETKSENLTKK